ncbi:MAG: protein kinase [Phycisphaerae bacterium]|nr:protein kinase [Phycisphaerae bacterium]
MSMVKPGDRIGNYLLEERVGAGSFGEVWRARHHVFDETVAIKVLTDPQYVRNFRQEGVVVHGLQHPNIVRVFDIDPYADPPYLIMEYVDGSSLRQIVDAHPTGLPIPVVVKIGGGILSALSCAHDSGLVHRDIKPANILLSRSADALEGICENDVKVADFGLGRACGLTTHSLMQSGSLLTEGGKNIAGTLAYMSPEQKTSGELDGRSDLYSCGIVLFEMLTGVRPEGHELPSAIRPEVPPHLDDVFKRCYTRREKRYANAGEMREYLAGDLVGFAAAPPPPPPVPQSGPKATGASGARICTKCRHQVEPDDQFCIHCGKQLVEAVPRCQSCRAFVNKTDNFCILCGTDLRVRS